MPDLLYTAVFNGLNRGWTESYVGFQAATNLVSAQTAIQPFWQARAALLGANVRIQATKVSSITDIGDSYLVYLDYLGNPNEAVNDLESSVNVRLTSANGRYRKLTFLRGAWDVVFNDGNFNANQAAWLALFNTFAENLIGNSLGWLGVVDNPTTAFVSNYTQLDNGLISFTVTPSVFLPQDINKKKSVRFSGMGIKSVLNRKLVVIPQTPTTCITAAPIGAAPYQGTGFITIPTYVRRTADQVVLQRIGRRPAGAPLLQPVGRGRNRPRY